MDRLMSSFMPMMTRYGCHSTRLRNCSTGISQLFQGTQIMSWTKIQLLQNMQQLPATAKPMIEFATGTYEKFAARRRSG